MCLEISHYCKLEELRPRWKIDNKEYIWHFSLRTVIMNSLMCTDDDIPTAVDDFCFVRSRVMSQIVLEQNLGYKDISKLKQSHFNVEFA
jgi:hypothetical protein